MPTISQTPRPVERLFFSGNGLARASSDCLPQETVPARGPPSPARSRGPAARPEPDHGRGRPPSSERQQPGAEGPQGRAAAHVAPRGAGTRNDRNSSRGRGRLPATRSVGGQPAPACPRCGQHHTGLCAMRPEYRADMAAAVALGVPRAALERDAKTQLRQRAIGWVYGLKTKVTARSTTGKPRDRALAIAECGRPTPVYSRGVYWVSAKSCGDRACPRCAYRRSSMLAADMRIVADERRADGKSLWFVTLTQPKPYGANPKPAIDGAMKAWRRLVNPKTHLGAQWHDTFDGCVRALEVTWSPKDKVRRDGSVVPYSGWHAHFHVIVEGGSRAQVEWMVARWRSIVGGAPGAQKILLADDRRIGELCKYIVKPIVEDVPAALCRELFGVLHRRRLCEGVGSWKGWRGTIEREPPKPVLWCHVSAAKLAADFSSARLRKVRAAMRSQDSLAYREVVFSRRVGAKVEEHAAMIETVVRENFGWLTRKRAAECNEGGGPCEKTQGTATGPP